MFEAKKTLLILPLVAVTATAACESKPAGADDAVQGGMLKDKSKIQTIELPDSQKIVAPDMVQDGSKIVAPDMVQGGQQIVAPDMVQAGQQIVAPDMIQGDALIGEDGKYPSK